MQDPLEALSDEQLYLLAANIITQLEKSEGTRPVVYLLAQQRARAVKAIIGLVNVDPSDTNTIRGFQQEAALYFDLIVNCREMIDRGRQADANIGENERIQLASAINQMEPEEKRLLNIETNGED